MVNGSSPTDARTADGCSSKTAISTARAVIRKCGGHAAVAEILGSDVSRVYRFTYPRVRGGTNGLIPAKHQHRLLAAARERGFALSPDDFFADIPRPKRDWLFVASRRANTRTKVARREITNGGTCAAQ